ncbi:MAG: D-cysteine desulfhydrase family protein [Bacillota bacterium]|nr:MAG: D-cysteine desulfhydrase family protein [Bacillota bacterium]
MSLGDLPRARLSTWPTPLDECPRLSAALGGPHLWVKRDDLTDLGLGGNKVRKLEYLLGDAILKGADTIITPGALQSNHARLTAAACRRLGLEVVLVLTPGHLPGREAPQGNLLLDHLFGARIVFTADDADETVAAAMADVAGELELKGRHPYIVPLGGSDGVGSVGYVAAALEIAAQSSELGVHFDHLLVTTGSGGTHAGLQVGAALHLAGTDVHGVTISREPAASAARVDALVSATVERLGLSSNPAPPAVVHGGYAGEGYGIPTRAGWEAILTAARTEGLVLDPVYTGKALSGLIGLIREGAFPTTANILFVHTGGSPGLMAQAVALHDYLASTTGNGETAERVTTERGDGRGHRV